MPESHLLGSFVRRFLLESVIADRNLSRNTQTSYRDAIRLLLRFIAERYHINATDLTVEDVNAEVVRNTATPWQPSTSVLRQFARSSGSSASAFRNLSTWLRRLRRCLYVKRLCRRYRIPRKKKWTLSSPLRIEAVSRARGTTRCSSSSITPAHAPAKPLT